ncbi:MAG: hypothetical protein WGN25_05045 [Candidatus Electrothrix sp. GW3-4]|uniref:hypothetical protein n=1 Tax=Candidatus Electrothrix sp. GW3-4 TaxID=3126740 RepID=UPI0030D1390A
MFDTIIHSGGQRLNWSFAALWVLFFLVINLKKQFLPYRKILLFFLVATAALACYFLFYPEEW